MRAWSLFKETIWVFLKMHPPAPVKFLGQRSSPFLAPGTSFMEDKFFHGLGWGVVSGLCNLLLFGHQVISNSLRPHRLQHTRPLSPFMCALYFYYCAFCFYYYPINSTSDHQALDSGGRHLCFRWLWPQSTFWLQPHEWLWTRPIWLRTEEFLTHKNHEIINVCCFRLLSLGGTWL